MAYPTPQTRYRITSTLILASITLELEELRYQLLVVEGDGACQSTRYEDKWASQLNSWLSDRFVSLLRFPIIRQPGSTMPTSYFSSMICGGPTVPRTRLLLIPETMVTGPIGIITLHSSSQTWIRTMRLVACLSIFGTSQTSPTSGMLYRYSISRCGVEYTIG